MRVTVCLLVLLAAVAVAQQPNTPGASLLINATGGPPYPIQGIQLPTGVNAFLNISGNANMPVVLAGAPSVLTSGGIPTAGGLLDLDLFNVSVLANGLVEPAWNTGAGGMLSISGPIPLGWPTGVTQAYQAAVVDPATLNFTFTAASEFTITQGITLLTLGPFGGTPSTLNAFSTVDLTPYNVVLPFYSQMYTQMFVSSNGYVSFESANSDFTPTPSQFQSQMPRIAGFWVDLEPGNCGCVTVTIDPTGTFDRVRVDYNDVPEFGSGPNHTFAIEIQGTTGDILIENPVTNPPSALDQITGISPGSNLSTAGQKDLSMMNPGGTGPITGAPNEIFWEWFGLTSMPFYTPNFDNPFDLTGVNVRFLGMNAGFPGAGYLGTN